MKLMITVSPVIFGQGLSLFSEPTDIELRSISFRSRWDRMSFLLHYRVHVQNILKNAFHIVCSGADF